MSVSIEAGRGGIRRTLVPQEVNLWYEGTKNRTVMRRNWRRAEPCMSGKVDSPAHTQVAEKRAGCHESLKYDDSQVSRLCATCSLAYKKAAYILSPAGSGGSSFRWPHAETPRPCRPAGSWAGSRRRQVNSTMRSRSPPGSTCCRASGSCVELVLKASLENEVKNSRQMRAIVPS